MSKAVKNIEHKVEQVERAVNLALEKLDAAFATLIDISIDLRALDVPPTGGRKAKPAKANQSQLDVPPRGGKSKKLLAKPLDVPPKGGKKARKKTAKAG